VQGRLNLHLQQDTREAAAIPSANTQEAAPSSHCKQQSKEEAGSGRAAPHQTQEESAITVSIRGGRYHTRGGHSYKLIHSRKKVAATT